MIVDWADGWMIRMNGWRLLIICDNLRNLRIGMLKLRELMRGKGERQFVIFLLVVIGIFLGTPVSASENPDELYRLGRFAEAEKIYADSDMDNPKDLRYRYNRGCANYQGADYKGAMASFSSVLRRAKDSRTRLKAAYNLGNTAFKQGDFASAAAHYKKAILIDPESENARYNLEIALRRLEKQKKEQKEGQKCSGKEENKKDQSKDGKKGPPKDLSGDLRPREALPQKEKDEGSGQAISLMDRKKAEALLDNVKEDRSKYLEFQTPKGKRRGVLSGKDW